MFLDASISKAMDYSETIPDFDSSRTALVRALLERKKGQFLAKSSKKTFPCSFNSYIIAGSEYFA